MILGSQTQSGGVKDACVYSGVGGVCWQGTALDNVKGCTGSFVVDLTQAGAIGEWGALTGSMPL